MGDHDQAFDWLHKALDTWGDYLVETLGVDPRFDPLRKDDRWQAVMAHLEAAKSRDRRL